MTGHAFAQQAAPGRAGKNIRRRSEMICLSKLFNFWGPATLRVLPNNRDVTHPHWCFESPSRHFSISLHGDRRTGKNRRKIQLDQTNFHFAWNSGFPRRRYSKRLRPWTGPITPGTVLLCGRIALRVMLQHALCDYLKSIYFEIEKIKP